MPWIERQSSRKIVLVSERIRNVWIECKCVQSINVICVIYARRSGSLTAGVGGLLRRSVEGKYNVVFKDDVLISPVEMKWMVKGGRQTERLREKERNF